MHRNLSPRRALWNAAFALAALGLATFGVVEVSSRHWQWQETFAARAQFATIGGLESGAKVLVQGMDAGVVESIVPPRVPGGPVTLVLRLDARLRPLVRSDATARISTQGVVGSKLVEVVPGRPDAPPLAAGQVLRSEPPLELSDVLARATASLRRVDAVAESARRGLDEIGAIAATVRRGEGTLGRLVNDDEAYRRLVALSRRGESALVSLEENLAAIKSIWPISAYFKSRGFTDPDRLLYQPGSARESRVLAESELFEPGRAVLTDDGRARLDELARWFKARKPTKATEVVIAAFTDRAPGGEEELAQILTQDQAEAVRAYLVEKHQLDIVSWFNFGRRKIAAVGFGTQAPRTPDADSAEQQPARRIEIILFTPQNS